MLGQSKNAFQAEIDSACEIIDFLRFNVQYMTEIYADQPISGPGVWNRLEWRPLEGFSYALTPFNFTAIAGNLPTSCAMMGNVVVWRPSNTQVYSANVLMAIFKKAGSRVQGNQVFIDAKLVERRLETVPPSFPIYSSTKRVVVGKGKLCALPPYGGT